MNNNPAKYNNKKIKIKILNENINYLNIDIKRIWGNSSKLFLMNFQIFKKFYILNYFLEILGFPGTL